MADAHDLPSRALTALTEGGDRFKCVGLLRDEYVAIPSSDHPIADEPELSIESFASLPHINIIFSGDDTHLIDAILCRACSRGAHYRNGINAHGL